MSVLETEHLYLVHSFELDWSEEFSKGLLFQEKAELESELRTSLNRVFEMVAYENIEYENDVFVITRKPDRFPIGCTMILYSFGCDGVINDAPFVGNGWIAHDNPYCERDRLSDAEIKCWILPEFRNLGYATEAMKALIQHAFIANRSIDKLWVRAEHEEADALRIAEKCGFSGGVIRMDLSRSNPDCVHATRFLTLQRST